MYYNWTKLIIKYHVRNKIIQETKNTWKVNYIYVTDFQTYFGNILVVYKVMLWILIYYLYVSVCDFWRKQFDDENIKKEV